MSPIKRNDLHIIFKNLDKNNNGKVTIHELQNLLRKIGIETTSDELEKLVGRNSLDYDGFLSFYEMVIETKIPDNAGDDDMSKAFEIFDANGDGVISCDELETVLTKMGMWEKKNSGEDCNEMIGVYNKNSDGVLDFEEFKDMMMMPLPNIHDNSEMKR